MKYAAIIKVKESNMLYGDRQITIKIAPNTRAGVVPAWDIWAQVGDGKVKKMTKGSYCPTPLEELILSLSIQPIRTEYSTFDLVSIERGQEAG